MPMNRSLYPKNWGEIALSVKQSSGWRCEQCDRPCRTPGENVGALMDRIALKHPEWESDLTEEEETEEFGVIPVPKPTRFILTVAHLDHRPENCDRSNLKALCAPCHCRYDAKQWARKRQLNRERMGQLSLLSLSGGEA